MAATTARAATPATTETAPERSTSSPSFYVTAAPRMATADLEPGTAGVAVPAMARHVPETFEGLMMEAHRE